MILVFIAAWLAYKKAKEANRSGIAWALIISAAFIGTQLLVAFGAGIFIVFFTQLDATDANPFGNYELLVNILCIVASLIVSFLILKYLGRVPPDDSFTPPPDPPKFDGEQR